MTKMEQKRVKRGEGPFSHIFSKGRSKDEVKRAPPVPSFSVLSFSLIFFEYIHLFTSSQQEIHRNTSPRNNNNNSSSFVKAGGMSASGAMEMYHQHFLQVQNIFLLSFASLYFFSLINNLFDS